MSELRTPGAFLAALVAVACFSAASQATAGIIIDTTRVVYPAARREVTIGIRNNSAVPSLVQAWLDAGDPNSSPGETAVPFVLTPPVFRLDPAKSQSVRLVYTQEPLPADRESLFWLNVMDIPPRGSANPERPNQMEMAFKHRMKVFFRPAGLKGSAADAPARLTWKLAIDAGRLTGIQVTNPTAYHVSLILVTAAASGQTVKAKSDMVAPFGSARFELEAPVAAPAAPLQIHYTFVNDYGGNVKATATAAPR